MKVNGQRLLDRVRKIIEERHLSAHEQKNTHERTRRRVVNEVLNGMSNRELVLIIGDALHSFEEHHDQESESSAV